MTQPSAMMLESIDSQITLKNREIVGNLFKQTRIQGRPITNNLKDQPKPQEFPQVQIGDRGV